MNRYFRGLAVVFLFVGNYAFAQCPDNIGFESGTLNNWVTYSGLISPTGIITVAQTPPLPDKHTITKVSDNAVDYFGGFPTVSPNGSTHSVKLGNDGVGREVDRLSYTLTVPAVAQYSLVLNYAVVLQNSNHRDFEQPRFTVTVFNVTDNNYVACPAFDFIASENLPGFRKSLNPPNGASTADVYYKDWSATTINLSAYTGKEIRLEFTVNDCTPGGDFGYAYFDLNEECTQLVTGNTYCESQNAVNLVGPKGFLNYTWYNEDLSQEIGQGQVLRLDPAPADGTKFALVISTFPGLGCTDTVLTTLHKSPIPFSFVLKDEVLWFCKDETVNLTAASVTEGSSAGLKFKYYKDAVTLEYLRDPEKVAEPGVYYIEASNNEGCLNILPIEIRMYDESAIVVTDPAPVQYPEKIDLSTTFPKTIGYTYSYYSDEKATKPLTDYMNVGVSGKYYVKAINANGCAAVVAINVVITPPENYVISVPTAFTPNGDGVNDTFDIKIDGFVTINSLTVYNRNGQRIFKTNNAANRWDGRFNGNYLPVGTYYWFLECFDMYKKTFFTKNGYVSIIK